MGIEYILRRKGVDIVLERDKVPLPTQRVVISKYYSPENRADNLVVGSTVRQVYLMICPPDIDIRRGDVFAYESPTTNRRNMKVFSIDRTFIQHGNHIQVVVEEFQ